jgi:hypothetical protein
MTFAEHLKLARGSLTKARREYIRERRWFADEWYEAWPRGLGDEVESAARQLGSSSRVV